MRNLIGPYIDIQLLIESVNEIAKGSGIPQSSLDKYIKNQADLKGEQLSKLLEYLNVKIILKSNVDSKEEEDLL